jgi:hypothetical protein
MYAYKAVKNVNYLKMLFPTNPAQSEALTKKSALILLNMRAVEFLVLLMEFGQYRDSLSLPIPILVCRACKDLPCLDQAAGSILDVGDDAEIREREIKDKIDLKGITRYGRKEQKRHAKNGT